MLSNPNTRVRASRRARLRRAGLGLLAVVAGVSFPVACSTKDLLSVQVPNSVSSNLFNDPVNATLLVNSGIGAFEFAFGSFIRYTGVATDELRDATLAAANWPLDRRDNNSLSNGGLIYTPMSIARTMTDQAITNLNGWTAAQVPNKPLLLAEAYVYSGFAYATLGMSLCQSAFDGGPLVNQAGVFTLAETRFTSAIAAAQAVGNTQLLNAAYVGRARVRLYLHNTAGAATDAALVPKGFVFNANNDATTSRRYNNLYSQISTSGNNSVAPESRALNTETGQADPRAAVTLLTTKAQDGLTQIFIPNKYNAATLTLGEAIPLPMAHYEEAQLILAEIQGGAAAVTIVNALRAAVGLNPYTGATDAASITTLVVGERQRALFVEGFRFFDVERLSLPLSPAVGTAFQWGGSYGGTICLPLPSSEWLNNNNIVQSALIDGVSGDFKVP